MTTNGKPLPTHAPSELPAYDSESNEEGSEDGQWQDVEPDRESINVQSLLDAESFPTLAQMLDHCKTRHRFDLVAVSQRLQLDFIGTVKLVNFIRHRVQEGRPLPAEITQGDIDDDAYLKPVLENDAVIFSLDEVLKFDQLSGGPQAQPSDDQVTILQARNRELEAELELVRNSFANYRLAAQQALDRRWSEDDTELGSVADPSANKTEKNGSDSYFESYAERDIHETMLKDRVRTDAYRDFIYANKHIFRDKVVLDIGCGTGILSMFCAKAGAAQVIAVDKSDIIDKARANIFHNRLSETVTCLRGAIEDVQLPVGTVDIIVSEWMGYCLLYEAMLPSVLYARDKYLRPGGLLVPSSATLWIAPVEDQGYVWDNISYWRDVYGFDMKAMQEGIHGEVRIETMPTDAICGEPFPLQSFDLRHTRKEDLNFSAEWKLHLNRPVDKIDGFLIWFDIFFSPNTNIPAPEPQITVKAWLDAGCDHVAFTTGPFGAETHWKQGLLLSAPEESPDDSSIPCNITGGTTFASLEENSRALSIDVFWTTSGERKKKQSWKLK